MADMTEKLYPPTINETCPAFYKENGIVKITIPFSMNRAATNDIKGFSLKIRTVYSNSLISLLKTTKDIQTVLKNKEVSFILTDTSNMVVGQYFKVQLAYISKDDIVGYYSTVGIAKYTTKPKVYIYNLTEENETSAFQSKYIGVYEPTEDISERPYSYNFLLKQGNNVIEESGWKIHNSEIPRDEGLVNSLAETASIDTYCFTHYINNNSDEQESYSLSYKVRTINNLEISSPIYILNEPILNAEVLENLSLQVENIFDEGYIKLSFSLSDNNTTLESPLSIAIFRADDSDNFTSQKMIKTVYFSNNQDIIKNGSFKDFAIKQGSTYKYSFRALVKNNNYSTAKNAIPDTIMADFEDMFLWDGKSQVKIRFNPQVTSFKTNYLEQKIETIGSQYPFIFRNGVVKYKEFPISGLISYKMDNHELFINAKDDLNIILGEQLEREKNPANQDTFNQQNVETFDLVNYNIAAERKFKLKLLDWLSDGKIKMFKSPTEGNYLVRLLNVSLSPEKTVGRMLHNFSCTAYEVKDYNYDSLVDLKFIIPKDIDSPIGIAEDVSQEIFNDEAGVVTGPAVKTFVTTSDNSKEILNFYVLKFKKKTKRIIYQTIGEEKYYFDKEKTNQVVFWDPFTLYEVKSSLGLYSIKYIYIKDDGTKGVVIIDYSIISHPASGNEQDLILNTNSSDNLLSDDLQTTIDFSNEDNLYKIKYNYYKKDNQQQEETIEEDLWDPANEKPLSTNGYIYSKIEIGPGIYAQYAYHEKTTKKYE